MRHFTARRLALAALVPALFVLSVIPGCSNEGEGERCGDPGGDVTNNDDCQSGLTCTAFPAVGTGSPFGRCCYTDHHVTDSRCAITTGVSATNSSAGAASTTEAGAAGSASVAEPAGAGGL